MGWLRRVFGRPEHERMRDDGWIELPAVGHNGDFWAGELWEIWPVYAPREVDVGEFLGQRPLPYVWEDPSYRQYIDSMADATGHLLWSWLYVFVHHPDKTVVCDALRQPEFGRSLVDGVVVADLVMLHRDASVREEAVNAAWRLDDHGVRQVVRVLRDDRELDPSVQAPYSSDAVDRVLAAVPRDRTALADELHEANPQ